MSYISSVFQATRQFITHLKPLSIATWRRYRALPIWKQVAIVAAILLVLFGLSRLTSGGATTSEENTLPSVITARIDALAGTGSSVSVIGAVRSITEADVLAQSGGAVTAVHGQVGAYVGAGYLIAELDNASQRAAVIQAQGAYDAAVAGRSAASVPDIAASARNTYTAAFSTLDTLLKSDIDTVFGAQGAIGPQLLISPSPFDSSYFPPKRRALAEEMDTWRTRLSTAASADPQALLDEANSVVSDAIALSNDLLQAATKDGTDATTAERTALAAARSGFAGVQTSITVAKSAYQGQNTSATAGADASVKIALGSLRGAEAQLEKTFVRAPIGGTLNFMPLHVGDYVAPLTHVATVAQNGALEIVAYVSEEARANLSVGSKITVENTYPAVVTSLAPALDPVKKQFEMHVALTGTSTLVNGQSVNVNVPTNAPTQAQSAGPILLPLTAVKLTPSSRVVFVAEKQTDADGTVVTRLVAEPVEIGEVHGDRIEVTSTLTSDVEIVTDARGLSDGEKVSVATSTP